MSEKKTHIIFKILKVLGWTVLSLGILVAAIRLSLKTSWVHSIAKKQVVSIANQSLNGSLSIHKIEGDLWKDFSISGIVITQADTLLNLENARVQYNIWDLLNKTFSASEIKLSGLSAFVSETAENEFNIQQLIKPDTTQSTSAFALDIQHFEVENAEISVSSPSYLPDSTLSIKSLNATAGFSFYDEISASLSSLSFQLVEGRLPQPISFETAASYQDQIITLNQLVIETGRSLIRANGVSDFSNDTLTAQTDFAPFSLKDLEPYLQNPLPNDQLQLSLKAGGRLDSLNLELKAEGEGFDDFLAVSNLTISETPSLNKFGISLKNLDAGYFTNDSVQVTIGELQASLEGHVNEDIENADITWGFTLHEIQYEDYFFNILFGSGTLKQGNLLANVQLSDGKDEIVFYPSVKELFSDMPQWNLQAHFTDIDLSWWLRNPELEGTLSFRAKAEGRGFELSKEPWTFSVYKPMKPLMPVQFMRSGPDSSVSKSKYITTTQFTNRPSYGIDTVIIGGQKFSDINVNGRIDVDSLNVDGFIKMIDNQVLFSTVLHDYLSEKPTYTFDINTSGFDASEIIGIHDFPTSVNLKTSGSGTHFDPDKLQLKADLLIDSSYVNGAEFSLLDISAELENNILNIPSGRLVSDVIEGTFSGRRNLADQSDPENDFALDMEIKNLQPLATLAGTEKLNATGTVTGNITEIDQQLLFDGNVNLSDVNYDTLFSANSIRGVTKISIGREYGYDLSLDISEPVFSGLKLQDVKFAAVGTSAPDSLTGNFNLDIASKDAGQISQSGKYKLDYETLKTELHWFTFEFVTPARILTMQSPFRLLYQNSSIQTDTLMLRSAEGTFLNIAIPYADSVQQKAWIQGQDFDFGVMQEIIFDERFVDGVLSGYMEVSHSPEDLTGAGALDISNLAYKGTDIDFLNLDFSILSKRLSAQLGITMNGEEKVTGSLDVPFMVQDPSTFDDSFFEEPVRGYLVIKPVQITDFQNILNAFEITQTNGILSFNGELSGTAGEPNMEGVFNLGQPTLSGIEVDTAFAEFRYHHLEKKVTALAEIDASGQRAASVKTELPISMDFRTLKLNMPGENDSLQFHLTTDNFNVSVFNDFLDKQYVNKLRGVLNADIDIAGTKSTLIPKGFLNLSGARISVPIAGINLTKINSELQFSDKGLQLNRMNITSGSGTFSASGGIELEGITPKNLDITAKATRFQLANTNDYNLTVDLNSKLTGQPMRPKVSGVLTVKNGFVFLQDFGERSVETVQLDEEEVSSFSPYDSLSIDMRFVIERNFLVRNRRYLDLEVALTGELDAQKQVNSDLELFGALNAERGYARPLGKNFTVDEGAFTFSGPITEPDLYIKTSYIPQSSQKEGDPIVLYYIIEGTALDPTFRFESDPYMEQEDIVCYTLFNKPCYALESWQQVVSGSSGSSPANLLVDVLLDEVETLATQELGIDVVQIDNTQSGTTSIKTGWYLNRRTFFAIVNEISGTTPKTLFILEYLLKENLDLIITQGDDNRQGIDIRWQYDY